MKPNSGQSLWTKLLNDQQLTETDIKEIISLYKGYQKELNTIMELERKLEAHPEDSKLRQKLREELTKKISNLKSLEAKFFELGDGITRLQTAIGELQTHLQTGLNKINESKKAIKGAGVEIKENEERIKELKAKIKGTVEEDKEELNEQIKVCEGLIQKSKESQIFNETFIQLELKRCAGDLSTAQVEEVTRLTEKLKPLALFNQKIAFAHETYWRFSKRGLR